jgi:hypothetical protein
VTEIIDPADVVRIFEDPRFLVPEPNAPAVTSFDLFRARVSRFANGTTHAERRARLNGMLAMLDPGALAADAGARTRRMLRAHADPQSVRDDERRTQACGTQARGTLTAAIARHVPVATLALALGFRDPDEAPPLVARVADEYPTGRRTAIGRQDEIGTAMTEDEAIERLRTTSGAQGGEGDLRVQLLVQAYAATGSLVIGAMRRLAASVDSGTSTRDLLHRTLRDDPPVPTTRRIAPDGTGIVLRLDGHDRDGVGEHERRLLAFGEGPRRCPAPHHALAIAGAVIDELRAGTPQHPSVSSPADHLRIRGATHADRC